MSHTTPILITPDWLSAQLNSEDLIILDASIPAIGTVPDVSKTKTTILSALRFDIEGEFSDSKSPYPHTMISPQDFTEFVRALGVNSNSQIVVYDDMGIFSAPRAWWMFKAMGHDNISILNGGLPAWQLAGLPCDKDYGSANQKGNFEARPLKNYFVNMHDIENIIETNEAVVIDARSADRFFSRVDEPRPGLRRGNIPGSINLPFNLVLENGAYKNAEQLAAVFDDLQINNSKPLYFSCGSGVTACIDAVAAKICGFEKVSVYDGSWCEWGSCKPAQ